MYHLFSSSRNENYERILGPHSKESSCKSQLDKLLYIFNLMHYQPFKRDNRLIIENN